MTNKNLSKKYESKLTAAINDILSRHRKRNSKSNNKEDLYSDGYLATCLGIEASNLSNALSGKNLCFKHLLRFISMPWIAKEDAQRCIFLWIAKEIDSHPIPNTDEGTPTLLDDYSQFPLSSKIAKLNILRDSMGNLANYTQTLGVIDQIDYARERQRKVIQNDGYSVPIQGPKISSMDFDKPSAKGDLRRLIRQRPMTDLVLKFAKDLAEQESQEYINEIDGYLQDEILEKMGDEIDRYNEEDREENQEFELKNLGIEVADHVEANKSANIIMMQLKANSKNLE